MLRPRCWSGRKSTLSPRSKAHSNAVWAFEEVQIVPPWRPVKALMAAELFMYDTGTVVVGDAGVLKRLPGLRDLLERSPYRPSSSRLPGRAARRPAWSEVRMSALSAMKWTPQKTM